MKKILIIVALLKTACFNVYGESVESPKVKKNVMSKSTEACVMPEKFNVIFTDPRVKAAKAGHNTAGYTEISNMTTQDLQIVKAHSSVAQITELHISIEENHIHKMRPVSFISIEKGETAVLQPGGLHIMLVGLKEDLVEGRAINIVLTFNNGNKITVPFIVKNICNHCH